MLIEDNFRRALRNTAQNAVDIKENEKGIIVSVNPLQINVGGLILTKKNLYINYELLEHNVSFKMLTGTIGDSTTTITNGSIFFSDKLEAGDTVIVREMQNNKYYVACKIVGGEE